MKALLLAVLLALPARAQEAIFLVRHAEKVDTSKDAALSPAGEARAQALALKLRDAGIGAIFATELKRTQQTALPLAEALKLVPQVHPANDSAGLAALLKARHAHDRVLVVGHSNTLPEIAAAYGLRLEIADGEYDALWLLLPQARAAIHLRQ